MRRWSETYAESEVRFACVCVDGRPEDVCAEFQDLYFKDSSVFNAFIREQQDFPTFPSQLGCQGFVVVDARGSFATLRFTCLPPSFHRVVITTQPSPTLLLTCSSSDVLGRA